MIGMTRGAAPSRALIGAAAAALLTAAFAAVPPAEVPRQVTRGSYQGTWYRNDRASNIAVWLEELKGGKVRMRYRYTVDNGSYGDSTDTGSGSSYSLAGTGPFRITYALEKDGVIRGTMTRTWVSVSSEITERNRFEIYRIEQGDRIYCRNYEVVREAVMSGVRTSSVRPDSSFVLVKATDEIVHWEELPF